jgi:hypothetical protein
MTKKMMTESGEQLCLVRCLVIGDCQRWKEAMPTQAGWVLSAMLKGMRTQQFRTSKYVAGTPAAGRCCSELPNMVSSP